MWGKMMMLWGRTLESFLVVLVLREVIINGELRRTMRKKTCRLRLVQFVNNMESCEKVKCTC